MNILVIGNLFRNAESARVWTLNSLYKALTKNQIPSDTEISFGQGVSLEQAIHLRAELVQRVQVNKNQVQIPEYFYDKADASCVHKKLADNVIISSPKQQAQSTFRSFLFITHMPDCLRDHISGKHIPGMLLVEAVRQTLVAICEQERVNRNISEDIALSFQELESQFLSFTYPFCTELISEVRITDRSKSIFSVQLKCSLSQADQLVGTFKCSAQVHLKSKIRTYEDVLLSRRVHLLQKKSVGDSFSYDSASVQHQRFVNGD